MPVRISWGNETKTYVLFEFIGEWTWDEYYQTRKTGIEYADSVPHTVNMIIEYTQSRMFPRNMLSHFGSSMERNPKTFDVAVIVTQMAFVVALVNTLVRLNKKAKFRVARSREEAIKFFEEYDAQQAAKRSQTEPSGS